MIQIKNLSKIKNGRTILNLSKINVAAGEIISLIGTAGSGLETLLNLLIGKETPSAGEITFNGLIPGRDKNKLDERVGVLFQEDSLYNNQSAENNLQFFTRLFGLPQTRVSESLKDVSLADQSKVAESSLLY